MIDFERSDGMIGTLINTVAILVGTALGLVLRRGIPERMRSTVIQGQGLCVILIGISGALKTADTLGMIVCTVAGGLIGAAINIEKRLDDLGTFLERRVSRQDGETGSIAKGFVTASLMFCVGAMAIVGAMDSGLRGDHSTLLAKSALDGISAVFFASSLGIGVGLAAFAVLIYQGAFALLAMWLEPLLSAEMIAEMGAVGGLLIVGIGLNMIYDKRIAVENLLPAIFMPMLYIPLTGLIK